MAEVFSETWPGSNGSAWDSGRWPTRSEGPNVTVDVQSGRGRVVCGEPPFRSLAWALADHDAVTDFDLLLDWTPENTDTFRLGVVFGRTSNTAGYMLYIRPFSDGTGQIRLHNGINLNTNVNQDVAEVAAGTELLNESVTFNSPATTRYALRLQREGTAIRARVWPHASAEPDTWHIDTTDATHTAGTIGLVTMSHSTGQHPDIRWGDIALTTEDDDPSGKEVFTTSGTFIPPEGVNEVDVLIVGGGGGAGRAGSGGGGGGAGDVHDERGVSVTPGVPVTIDIGDGGAGATETGNGSNGTASSFDSITAPGGGGGGGGNGVAGSNGGSGGGGGINGAGGTATGGGNGGAGTQGSPGSNLDACGGGGGADTVGGNASWSTDPNTVAAGHGGNGVYVGGHYGDDVGDDGWVGGGGGGGIRTTSTTDRTPGQGGSGGGGNGNAGGNAPQAGMANTGGGGGGSGSSTNGANGGSGVVVVIWGEGHGGPVDPPSQVTGLAVSASGVNAVMTWDVAAGAVSYEGQRERWDGDEWTDNTEIFDTHINASFNDIGLEEETLYRWRVRGINNRGEGEWSDWEEDTTGIMPSNVAIEGVFTASSNEGPSSLDITSVEITGSDRYLLVGAGINHDESEFVTSVVLDPGGGNETVLSYITSGEIEDDGRVELWGVVNPPLGTHTVRITLNAALLEQEMICGAWVLSGVHQDSPVRSANGTGVTASSITVNVTSRQSDLVLGQVYIESAVDHGYTITTNAPATTDWDIDERDDTSLGAHVEAGVGSSTTLGWSMSANDKWAAAAVSIVSADGDPPDEIEPGVEFSLIGAVTDSSATVKARLNGAGPTATLHVSASSDLSNPTPISGVLLADNVWQFDIPDLTQETLYHYGFGATKAGQFKTFPTEGQQASFTIAAASCNQTASNSWAFQHIQNRDPALFIHMGDWGYADITTNNIARYRTAYKDNLNQSRQRSMFANVPMAYAWDDHDFGPNNAVGSHVGKPSAQQAFREYVPHYDLPADTRPGGNGEIYHTFVIGRVRFVILDCKSERSAENAPDDSSKTTLGADQKQWLKDTLLAATEPVIVLEVSEPWIGDLDPQDLDGWAMYGTERAELSQFFEDNDLTQRILLLHGDAHMLAADDGTNTNYAPGASNPGPPLFNFAPLDRSNSVKGGPYSEGTFTSSQTQYGTLEFADNGDNITVTGRGWQVNSGSETNVLTMQIMYDAEDDGSPPPDPTVPAAIAGTGTGNLTSPTTRAGKNQHWQWWTGTRWDGVLPTASGWRFFTDLSGHMNEGDLVDNRQAARVDTLWHNGSLWVLRGHTSTPRITRYTYSSGSYTPDTNVNDVGIAALAASNQDASPVTLYRTSNGRLWAAVVNDSNAVVAISDNNGQSWSTANVVSVSTTGVAMLTHTGNTVMLIVTQNEGQGRAVRTIGQGAGNISSGNWVTENLPSLPMGTTSDDHGMAVTIGGHIYAVSKTTGSSSSGQPLLYLLHRTPGGIWTARTLRPGPDNTGDTRPTLVPYWGLLYTGYGRNQPSTNAQTQIIDRYDISIPSPSNLFTGGGFSDGIIPPRRVSAQSGLLWLAHDRGNNTIFRVLWNVSITGTGIHNNSGDEFLPYRLTSDGLELLDAPFFET